MSTKAQLERLEEALDKNNQGLMSGWGAEHLYEDLRGRVRDLISDLRLAALRASEASYVVGDNGRPDDFQLPIRASEATQIETAKDIRCQSVLSDIRSPFVESEKSMRIDFSVDNDVPEPLRRELMALAQSKALSIYYLCAIYRQGRNDALTIVPSVHQAMQEVVIATGLDYVHPSIHALIAAITKDASEAVGKLRKVDPLSRPTDSAKEE